MFAVLLTVTLGQTPVPPDAQVLTLKLRNMAAADVAVAVGKAFPGVLVSPEPITNTIFMSGAAKDLARATETVNKLDVAPNQVFLSAKICEGDPLASAEDGTLKVLSQRKLMVYEGQDSTFQLVSRDRKPDVTVRMRAERIANNKVEIRVTSDLTVTQKHESTVPGVSNVTTTTSTRIDAEFNVRDGETKRFRISLKGSSETWIELRADVVRSNR